MYEYDDAEEAYDPQCFESAMQALSRVGTLKEIREVAERVANSEIFVCYTTSGRLKHHIHFLIKSDSQSIIRRSLMTELSRILLYDQVMVRSERVRLYKSITSVSENNLQGMLDFLKQYRSFLNGEPILDEQKSPAQLAALQGVMPAAREPLEKRIRLAHTGESSSGELDEKRENSSSPETISPSKKNVGFSSKQ